MAPHIVKRRKLSHDTANSNDPKISNAETGSVDDTETVDSDHDGLSTRAPRPSLVSKGSNKEVSRGDSRDGSLLANETYSSSMITLQVRDLLEEVRPNYASLLTSAEPVLRRLKASIEGFPVREPLTVRLRF